MFTEEELEEERIILEEYDRMVQRQKEELEPKEVLQFEW